MPELPKTDEGVVSYDNIVKPEVADVDNPPSNLLASEPAPKADDPKPAEPVAETPPATDVQPAEGTQPSLPLNAEGQSETPPAAKERLPKGVQKRLDTLTARWNEEKRLREASEARIAAFDAIKSAQDGETPGVAPISGGFQLPKTKAEFDAIVDQQAEQKAQQKQYQASLQSLAAKGNAEFPTDFNERCNFLASLGAGDRPEFMQTITSLDDGHKVLAELADHPDEVSRILSLPPIPMAVELAKLSTKAAVAPAPKRPVSNAPKPITPIDGSAKGNSTPSDSDDESTWFAKRMAQRDKNTNNRFARH